MAIKINLCKCGCGELCEQNYIRGHCRRGVKNSDEHNKRIGLANKGRKMSEEFCNKNRERNLGRIHSLETRNKISETHKRIGCGKWMIGRKLSEETKKKIALLHTGAVFSDERREKIRQSKLGERNGMHGKTHSDEYKAILKENIHNIIALSKTPEAIEKMRKSQLGKKASDETKRKMRISKINYIIKENGGVCPMHNLKACKFLDDLSKKNNWNLRHALNGGEFYIKELGYFVDGYDKDLNIIVEYDESLHYNKNGELKTKDIVRQNEIIKSLNCKFFRFNERENLFYEVLNTRLAKMEDEVKKENKKDE